MLDCNFVCFILVLLLVESDPLTFIAIQVGAASFNVVFTTIVYLSLNCITIYPFVSVFVVVADHSPLSQLYEDADFCGH